MAKDVAAYIDLYKKYEDHYGIPEILEGKVTTSIYERLFRASFDEKISVVHLVLSGLHTSFEAVHNWKKVTDKWFAFLKQYRSCVMAEEEPVAAYQKLCAEQEAETALRKKQGFLEKDEEQHHHADTPPFRASSARITPIAAATRMTTMTLM